jgi:hypothetical protein
MRMALNLLLPTPERRMPWKLKRKTTPTDRERIKSLEDQMADNVARLDAAVAESKRLSEAMDELVKRDPLHELRMTLKPRLGARRPPSDMDTYGPDETIN